MSQLHSIFFVRTSKFWLRLAVLIFFFKFEAESVLNLFLFYKIHAEFKIRFLSFENRFKKNIMKKAIKINTKYMKLLHKSMVNIRINNYIIKHSPFSKFQAQLVLKLFLFYSHCQPRCSYKLCSYKKRVY